MYFIFTLSFLLYNVHGRDLGAFMAVPDASFLSTSSNDRFKSTDTNVELTKDADDLNNKSLSSVAVNWNYQLTSDWQSNSKIQIDTNIGRLSKLELGVKYENECVDVNLSTSRSFSTSSTLLDKTDFTLSVELTGYSSNTRKIPKLHNRGI